MVSFRRQATNGTGQGILSTVSPGDDIYQIDPETCVECVGHFDEPKCVEMCPIDCIVPIAA